VLPYSLFNNHSFRLISSLTLSIYIKKQLQTLHESQLNEYTLSAQQSLTEYAQTVVLPGMEDTDTEQLYIDHCLAALQIPDWKLPDAPSRVLNIVRERAITAWQKQGNEMEGIGNDDIDNTMEDEEGAVVMTTTTTAMTTKPQKKNLLGINKKVTPKKKVMVTKQVIGATIVPATIVAAAATTTATTKSANRGGGRKMGGSRGRRGGRGGTAGKA
jgi:hypothetical protein